MYHPGFQVLPAVVPSINLQVEFKSAIEQIADAQTYTYSSVDIGTASSDRWVIITAATDDATANSAIASATINVDGGGANAMTEDRIHIEGTTGHSTAIFRRKETGGGSGTAEIIITMVSADNRACTISVHLITGQADIVVVDSNSQKNGLSPLQMNLASGGVVNGGAIIAVAAVRAISPKADWTASEYLVEKNQNQIADNGGDHSSAQADATEITAADSSVAIDLDFLGTGDHAIVCAVSYGKA